MNGHPPKRQRVGIVNDYSGYTLPAGPPDSPAAVERVEGAECNPREFFNRFVSRRRPCLLVGELDRPDSEFRKLKTWRSLSCVLQTCDGTGLSSEDAYTFV